MAAKLSGLEALTDVFKGWPYIKDKKGLGYSDVGDTQYPRYLCLDYYGWGDSPKNMWR